MKTFRISGTFEFVLESDADSMSDLQHHVMRHIEQTIDNAYNNESAMHALGISFETSGQKRLEGQPIPLSFEWFDAKAR